MIQFRCGQCGHRIAIHKRQLGSMIVCPDCATATHPIAEQVARSRAIIKSGPTAAPVPNHACANCAHPIGRLQKLHLWENHIVCGECHRKLSAETAPVHAVTVSRVAPRAIASQNEDPVLQSLTKPFRGGLFGALVGLCVAAAALYGAMSLLKDVAGIVTGLAIGGLALLTIYLAVRASIAARRETLDTRSTPLRITQKNK